MKALIIISIYSLCIFTSCDNSSTRDNQKQELPKVLEDKSASYSLEDKRGHEDLVESLYKELVDKTPELKELENKIDNLNNSQSDTTEAFNKFNGKNQSYYNSANRHADYLNDTLLKVKIKNMIAASLDKYKSSVSRHNAILDSIEVKNATLNDLHTILKITRTLPLIETYQRDNLPSTKPLEDFAKQVDGAINLADPDGNLWEIAYNPFLPLDDKGNILAQ